MTCRGPGSDAMAEAAAPPASAMPISANAHQSTRSVRLKEFIQKLAEVRRAPLRECLEGLLELGRLELAEEVP